MANKKTIFQKIWINPNFHPEFADWLEEAKGSSHEAFCKYCHVSFNLSNMGKQAVISHSTSAKHRKFMEVIDGGEIKQKSLKSFFVIKIKKMMYIY